MEQIPIIIPAYEPDERLIVLLKQCRENGLGPIILVNDGSGSAYSDIFEEAETLIVNAGGVVLTHIGNMGKGRALKTGFLHVINHCPEAMGVVTADSDGQHTAECINSVATVLKSHPNSLVLGVRQFDEEGIPWKSRFGNALTEKVFAYITGVHVSDTQTGLRGIPKEFMKELLAIAGERFEFEMQMLLECVGKYDITEVSIKTIYDSEENHQTHFNPVKDSVKIYRLLGKRFITYIFSSFSSSIIDLLLFAVLCYWLNGKSENWYVAVSTVLARMVSATYNYFINYKFVFHSKESIGLAGMKYALLAILQMCASALLVTFFVKIFDMIPEVTIKAVVDIALFFISYHIQQQYVFSKKNF